MNSKILLVDDTPENIDVLTDVLSSYELVVALNGYDALNLAVEHSPDLILLDIIMPGLNGFNVCENLKNNIHTKEIPIIFITSESNTDSIIKGFELGAIDYVTKPFNSSELLARVSTHLELKRSRDINSAYLKQIEQQNDIINASLQYAQKIQNASFPSGQYLNQVFNEYFLLFRPKDVVSGDFYWVRKIGSKLIVVIADCTGHGVPGAFMSMLGTALLTEIIVKEKIYTPADILNYLREKVIDSLNQQLDSGIHDGMDISIASIDLETQTLNFAGANNYGYLFRGNEFIKLECDRMPISIYSKLHPFKTITYQINKGDVVYLFSDGFRDQFGGAKDKKLKAPAFKNLLSKISGQKLQEQASVLNQEFNIWKGKNIQVDDVTVLGFEI